MGHGAQAQDNTAVKYDDASWHVGGDFPKDLAPSAGATHIAMFVAWAVLHGLGSMVHTEDFAQELAALRTRSIAPGQWFLTVSDGKFTSEDLNEEGNRFAQAYYSDGSGLLTSSGSYLEDYSGTFTEGNSLYHVPDAWGSYDALAATIQARFDAWRSVR